MNHASAEPVQLYARAAVVLGLLSVLAGAFGEAYVPPLLVVPGDAAATAANLVASESLFRWGFAAYLVEALCDAGLTLLFYLLLRVVGKPLALLAVFYRLLGTAVFAMAQVAYFAALPIAKAGAGQEPLAAAQANGLALLATQVASYGQAISLLFYGAGTFLVGLLMARSRFLPRLVGLLLALTGLAFVLKCVTFAVYPPASTPLLLVPAGLAGVVMTGWLLVRGVDVARWRERAAAQGAAERGSA